MQNTIEIKAMSKDAAVQRALKILDATSENIVSVIEKQKSKSFLGLFNKEGIYEITIDKSQRKEEKVLEKERKQTKVPKEEKLKEEKLKVEKKEEEKKEEKKPKSIIKNEQSKPKNKNLEVKNEVKKVSEEKVREDKSPIILEKTKTLLNYMKLDLGAEIASVDGKYYVVNLFGNDNGIIIGKKGKTLNSFEYLLNSMIKDCRIEIDVEGFKDKRNDTLRDLAKKMAEKALSSNKTIRLNPMPPRERKIIHEIINKYSELDTFSEGKDPKRYIVIKRKK